MIALTPALLGVAAGVLVGAGVQHTLIGLPRPRDRTHLAFGGVCVLAAAYVVTGAAILGAPDLSAYRLAVQLQIGVASALGAALAVFIDAFARLQRPRVVLGFVVAFLGAVMVLVTGGLGDAVAVAELPRARLPWGEVVSPKPPVARTGWLFLPRVLYLGLTVFLFYAVVMLVRRRQWARATALIVGAIAFWSNNALQGIEAVASFPWDETAFLAVMLVLGVGLSWEVASSEGVERALRSAEGQLRGFVESAPEAIAIFDVDANAFVDANRNALDLFGLEMDELRRADATTLRPDIQTDGTPSAALAARLTARALAGEPCAANWVVRAADGRETPCEVRLVRLPAPGRRLLRVSLLDMSERRRMEERERAIAEDLRQAQKLQAVAKLTGGLAHEFNNLLTVVKGNLELLSEDLEESGQQGLLQAASHATLRAIDLTQRLLAFSGHQALRTESVSLREHLRETLPALERAMGAGVRIELDLAEGLWSVEVDALGLENALLNLALNARDAMPRGGRIVMRAANRRVEISGVAAWGLHAAGDYVEVEVEDEGVGIAPDDLPRVTEPFFTTKGVGQGSGLGLSSVHGFVLQSGGGLRIESTPGLGTRVRFVLPRAQAAVRAPVARARAAAQGGGGETLLIVEDDPAVRAFTRTMFERAGYDVIAVADAPTALGVLATQPGVALLFTDVVLPGGVSGLALAQQVRRDHPRIPILFTSGYAEGDLGRVAGEDLPLEVLPKPFDRQHVLARVRSLLDSEARP